MPTLDHRTFERLVAEAIDSLPPAFRARLDNVEVVVEEWPDPDALRRTGTRHPSHLLGLYHGVPQTQRTHNYQLVLPDKISIYKRPIEMRCRSEEEVRSTIHRVLRHELGHHFGISDDRLREIGAY